MIRADATQPTAAGQSKSPQNQGRSAPEGGGLSARQAERDAGAAQLGVLDGERSAVELDRVAHHGEAQPMPRHALVGTHAALEHAGTIAFGDTRAVILD